MATLTPEEIWKDVLRLQKSSEDHNTKHGYPLLTKMLTTDEGKIVQISNHDPKIFHTIWIDTVIDDGVRLDLHVHVSRNQNIYFYALPARKASFYSGKIEDKRMEKARLLNARRVKEIISEAIASNNYLPQHIGALDENTTSFFENLQKLGIELEETA